MVSVTYHNLTAHYNAYFIAREKLKEVKTAIRENHQDNFNKILLVFPTIDSAVIDSKTEQLDDAFKKASIAIQRHKNSKWVDDSYILVGQTFYYQAAFVEAVETFKWVYTNSEDAAARHKALTWLMRVFIDNDEYNNAIYVSDVLKNEKLNKENYKNLLLTRAHIYQQREDYDNLVQNLAQAVPLMSNKDGKARIHYIIGQIYQMLGFEAEAYNNYTNVLKSNPEYELSFYAKLNMAQVTELKKSTDIKKVRKYFRNLLKDRKNEEFQDKIYYEMAEFELKQDNMDGAIDYYKQSVASSVNNPRQKGYSYLKLGELYYEHFKKYELAKSYYDSVITVLPADDEKFEAIKSRQEVLADFVEQINTIQLQDSLLTLSSLDSMEVMAMIDDVLVREQEKQEQQKEQKRRREYGYSGDQRNNGNQATLAMDNSQPEGSDWYFYNPSAVSLGIAEFRKTWGQRKLEDNWRRSSKESTATINSPVANNATVNPETSNEPEQAKNSAEGQRNSMYAAIPRTDAEKQTALDKIEEAHYNLGNIYNFQLNEKANSAEIFETLLDRFPLTEYKPEVLYLLYLIYKNLEDSRMEDHKNDLVENFPNTTYAKLILNPNYREESNAISEKLKKVYQQAYAYFKIDSLDQSMAMIEKGLTEYPDNMFKNHLELLKTLIVARTEGVYNYQFALSGFIEKHPDSELTPYAEELLKAIESHKQAVAKKRGVEFNDDLGGPHYFVMIYQNKDQISETALNKIEEHLSKYPTPDLKTSNLILDDANSMILVSDFKSPKDAMDFFQSLKKEESPLNSLENYKLNNFVITKENFQILYTTKGLDFYVKFFNKNYQQN